MIQFENAEKLNPPMEKKKTNTYKRSKKSVRKKKEIELREIPDIEANIEFKKNEK